MIIIRTQKKLNSLKGTNIRASSAKIATKKMK